jgi:hypothetical protein
MTTGVKKGTTGVTLNGFKGLGTIFKNNNTEKEPMETIVLKIKKEEKAIGVIEEEKNTPTYEIISSVEEVLIKVPKKTINMNYVKALVLPSGKKINQHWMNGRSLSGRYLNTFFYGIKMENLGRAITARIDIIEKTISNKDGIKVFTMINVYNTPDKSPLYRIKYPKKQGRGIEIFGTDHEIEFRKLKILA